MLYKLPISSSAELKLGIASTPEDRYQGLSGLSKLGKGKGLLITFDEVRKNWDIVNRGMNFPIDVVALRINDKKTSARITGIHNLTKFEGDKVQARKAEEELETLEDNFKTSPYDTVYIEGNAVLEIGKGEASKARLSEGDIIGLPQELTKAISKEPEKEINKKYQFGGTMDLETDISYNGVKVKEKDVKLDKSKLQVLDASGTIQMNIAGGNRIFSRQHTKMLKDLVETAETEEELENLGRVLMTVLDLHENQPEDYVDE